MRSLAIRNDNPAIALLPELQELQIISKIASEAFQSQLLPNGIKSEKAAFVIALKGRELGVPMFTSFSEIAIISGKPTMSAMLMLAQIRRLFPRAYIHFEEVNNERCIIVAAREKGDPTTRFEFTTDDAKMMGLIGKDNWNKYPRAMRRSRCVSEMARTIFPDALMGVAYTPEEIDPDLTVTEEGDVIDVPKPAPKVEPVKVEAPRNEIQQRPLAVSVFNEELGDFAAPSALGKIKKGQKLRDTPKADLIECLNYWKGKETKGALKVYLEKAQQFLDQMESPLSEVPEYMDERPDLEDAPF